MFATFYAFLERLRRGEPPTHYSAYNRSAWLDSAHAVSEAVRTDHVEMTRPVDRKRLEACVARWRALADLYQPDVRDTLILCADELEKTLTQRPTSA